MGDANAEGNKQLMSLMLCCIKYKLEWWPIPLTKQIADWEKFAEQQSQDQNYRFQGKIHSLRYMLELVGTDTMEQFARKQGMLPSDKEADKTKKPY